MKFTFTAALFAIASSAAAAPDASSVSQSLPPPEVHSGATLLKSGYLRGGFDHSAFARRLYPAEYLDNGCLGDNFKDKCEACMCIDNNTKRCDLSATPDGKDHCVDKKPSGAGCQYNWDCLSDICEYNLGTGSACR